MEADAPIRAPAARFRVAGREGSSDRRLRVVTLWLGVTNGEGLPKPTAKCVHLGLPCEEHQDATCRENQASHLTDLHLQAPAKMLGESGARTQGDRFWVGESQL